MRHSFIVAALCSALASLHANASEPLVDRFSIGERQGIIWPEKCCWLGLPKSEKLRAAAVAERCSAIGGPVGEFSLDAGKLMLTGLFRCSGSFPIKDIYPELSAPAQASWVSGVLNARLDYLCRDQANKAIYRTEFTLSIERGVVVKSSERNNDEIQCKAKG